MAWVMQIMHEGNTKAEVYSIACTKNPELKCQDNGVFINCPSKIADAETSSESIVDLQTIMTPNRYNLSISGRRNIDNQLKKKNC